jgi:hypothetical protein
MFSLSIMSRNLRQIDEKSKLKIRTLKRHKGAAPRQMRKMAQRKSKIPQIVKVLVLVTTWIAAVMWLAVFGDFDATLRAQSAANQASLQEQPVPQWQIDAGGKMAFDVVSVKTNKSKRASDIRLCFGSWGCLCAQRRTFLGNESAAHRLPGICLQTARE